MPRLAEKIALITGAASGIGYATAERFLVEGAIVILADRSKDKLADGYQALCGGKPPHRAVCMDVTDEQDWMLVAKEIDAAYGKLDVLVNNAGTGLSRSIEANTLQEWRATMAVNLDSVFLGTKYLLPLLSRSGRGSIVNVSSIIGHVSTPNAGCYSAAKAGVRGFTKSVALECATLRNGVRANAILPGQTRTPLLIDNIDDMRAHDMLARIPLGRFGEPREIAESPQWNPAEHVARIPLGRFGEPREIADAILFLASDESSFVTGAELIVDGGYVTR